MDEAPIPQASGPSTTADPLLNAVQSVLYHPLSGLLQGLETLRDRQATTDHEPVRQHLDVLIQVCNDLRDRARLGLESTSAEIRSSEPR